MIAWLGVALLLVWCVGMFGRGYWTPDEPREADIAWRMSWQADKAVPLLAGEAFCEKPPLTYWLAAVPIRLFGAAGLGRRGCPICSYAMITALGVGLLALRSAGPLRRRGGRGGRQHLSAVIPSRHLAGHRCAAARGRIGRAAGRLLGASMRRTARERLRGYLLMHAALGLGFLCKSAVAWMVPALAIVDLAHLGEALARTASLGTVRGTAAAGGDDSHLGLVRVSAAPDGPAHLKVFFWNNLVGRFARSRCADRFAIRGRASQFSGQIPDRIADVPIPWTLLVLAALRRAWRQRKTRRRRLSRRCASRWPLRCRRWSILSMAATARNIYLAPALPGVALLFAWWAQEISAGADRWDIRALRATAVLLLLGVAVVCRGVGPDRRRRLEHHELARGSSLISAAGLIAAACSPSARGRGARRIMAALNGRCCSPIARCSSGRHRRFTRKSIAGRIWRRSPAPWSATPRARPLILFAPDETTRAMIDMYARTTVELIPGPMDAAAVDRLSPRAGRAASLVLVQLPDVPGAAADSDRRRGARRNCARRRAAGRRAAAALERAAHLRWRRVYSLPNGRRYALLRAEPSRDRSGRAAHGTANRIRRSAGSTRNPAPWRFASAAASSAGSAYQSSAVPIAQRTAGRVVIIEYASGAACRVRGSKCCTESARPPVLRTMGMVP